MVDFGFTKKKVIWSVALSIVLSTLYSVLAELKVCERYGCEIGNVGLIYFFSSYGYLYILFLILIYVILSLFQKINK